MRIKNLFQDWDANSTDYKGRFIMFNFRIVNYLGKSRWTKLIFIPFFVFNKFFIQWILGVEIGSKAIIGKNCSLFHGVGLVINPNVSIGENCILRQGVTIGNKVLKDGRDSACPIIGDNVEFGASCSIIGDITIGNNVVIGAGSIVVKNIPDDSIVVGNPARILSNK